MIIKPTYHYYIYLLYYIFYVYYLLCRNFYNIFISVIILISIVIMNNWTDYKPYIMLFRIKNYATDVGWKEQTPPPTSWKLKNYLLSLYIPKHASDIHSKILHNIERKITYVNIRILTLSEDFFLKLCYTVH